jgi:hypothetical protein
MINEYKNLSVESIIQTIKQWKLEVENFRNDGWVQKGYEDKLKEVFSESGKALSNLKKIK